MARTTHFPYRLFYTVTIALVACAPLQNYTGGIAVRPSVGQDGTIHVPAFNIPFSSYLSETTKKLFIENTLRAQGSHSEAGVDIEATRKAFDRVVLGPWLERAKEQYPAKIEQDILGGVGVYIITPENGIADRNREKVLINLHGGGFTFGAGAGQLLESLPIASAGNMKVISIDYRQGPEYKFPAASEDITAVYRTLIQTYQPGNIGIYGCSAGGILTSMSIAWFQKEKLPLPGAIGIFCAGADALFGGDSRWTSSALLGQTLPPMTPNPPRIPVAYLSSANLNDPRVTPVVSPSVLAGFPPTLIITGTRATELSSAVHTHAQLTKAGVNAALHVWEGMWHGFLYHVNLPEAQEAYDVAVKFFNAHLGPQPAHSTACNSPLFIPRANSTPH